MTVNRQIFDALSIREHQFFGLLCCQAVYSNVVRKHSKEALVTVEKYLTGKVTQTELVLAATEAFEAYESLYTLYQNVQMPMEELDRRYNYMRAAEYISALIHNIAYTTIIDHYMRAPYVNCMDLLSVELKSDYVNEVHNPGKQFYHPEIKKLALLIQQEKDWKSMPQLGDALQDYSCGDLCILDHCYQKESHHLGCWVVEMLLK